MTTESVRIKVSFRIIAVRITWVQLYLRRIKNWNTRSFLVTNFVIARVKRESSKTVKNEDLWKLAIFCEVIFMKNKFHRWIEPKFMNKKKYDIIPRTRTQTNLQRFKFFKIIQKCNIQKSMSKLVLYVKKTNKNKTCRSQSNNFTKIGRYR